MVLKTGESSHRAALLGQGSLLGGRDCQVIIRKASSRTIEGDVLEEFIWPNGFREDLFNWSVTTIFVVPSARNTDIVYRTSHTVNKSLCLPVSVEKIWKISANQKQELSMATIKLLISSRYVNKLFFVG
jgi:hypothetical protein